MSKTDISLTISMVEAEAENLLRCYPYYPYQQAFAASGLRQKLVAYVLSRLPNLQTMIEDQEFSVEELFYRHFEQRQQVETLLHCGIQYLLTQSLPKRSIETDADEDMEEMNVGSTSSQWCR